MQFPKSFTRFRGLRCIFEVSIQLWGANSLLHESRRDDRKGSLKSRILFRPFVAFSLFFALPTVETVGYFLPPLRGSKQRDADADTRALEREIDQFVCALYGLTPEEIKLVEGGAK